MTKEHSVKEVSITPSLTSLIKPTADYLGAELKNLVKGQVEHAKESKRQENLKCHVEGVQQKIANDQEFEPNIQQLDFFEAWVDGVTEIDPKNKELSDIWQNLLISMGKTEESSDIILSKLKCLSPHDAKTLLKLAGAASLTEEDIYRLKTLEELELVQRNDSFVQLYTLAISLPVLPAIILFSIYGLPELFKNIFDKNTFAMSLIFDISAFILIPTAAYFTLIFLLTNILKRRGILSKKSRKLTWIGRAIIGLGSNS